MTPDKRFFISLPQRQKETLLTIGKKEYIHEGGIIFEELQDLPDLYILLEGYVALYRKGYRGGERVIFICSAGEALNEICLENSKASISALALSGCTILRVSFFKLEEQIIKEPAIERALYRSLSGKVRRLYHKTGNDNGTYTLKGRLSASLRKLARDCGVDTPEGRQINFPVTVNLLASMMGSKRETLSRTLSELKKDGVVSHIGTVLTVTDEKKLAQYI